MNNESFISPKVSVVLCTYNGDVFLREQIESVLQQTYSNLEVILSDDASSDNSTDIAAEFAGKDSRIQNRVNATNLGFNANFETAAKLATGDFIAFCDQDDIWHPEKLERMVKAFPAHASLVYCDSLRFENSPVDWLVVPSKKYRRFAGTEGRKISLFNTVSGHAVLIRREFLSKIIPFRIELYYDWYAAVVASCNGGVVFLPEVLVYQRVHQQNVSISKGQDHHDKKHKQLYNQMVSRHLAAFCNIENMPAAERHWFKKLSGLWDSSMHQKFSRPLFHFLVRNRKLIFYFKAKKFPFFSQVKHAYRLASNDVPSITES